MDWLAPVGTVYQAGTLSGNPLAMAAGIASLKRLEEQQPYAELEKRGDACESASICCNRERITVSNDADRFDVCLLFSDSVVNDYDAVLRCDIKFFPSYFIIHLIMECFFLHPLMKLVLSV